MFQNETVSGYSAQGKSKKWLGAGVFYLVIGPPGCGKTTHLTQKVLPLAIKEYGAEAVNMISLTNAAKSEMSGRDHALPAEQITTLHGLARRALDAPRLANDPKRLAEWNETCSRAFLLSGAAMKKDSKYIANARNVQWGGDALLAGCELNRHKLVPVETWGVYLREFWNAWCTWKQENELMDYTDWIARALDDCPTAPGDPGCIIVDEAQDFSRLEFALVKAWGERAEMLVLAGDFDQAIYAFKGADSQAFMSLGIPEERTTRLTQSYRVPRIVQEYATAWIEQAESRYPSEYKPRPVEGELVRAPALTMHSGTLLVHSLKADLAAGAEVMLLGASTYIMLKAVRALKDAGVPFHNPYQTSAGMWHPMRGGPERLKSLLLPIRLSDGADVGLWPWSVLYHWLECLDMTHEDFVRGGKALAKKRSKNGSTDAATRIETQDVFTPAGWAGLMDALNAGPRELLDWHTARRLGSWTKRFEYSRRLLSDHVIPRSSGTLEDQNSARRRSSERLLGLLWDTPRLVVGTIHSVKGGGADVVYLSPSLTSPSVASWSVRGPARDDLVRLWYVGITRTKTKLVLMGPNPKSPGHVKWTIPGHQSA